MSAGRGYEVFVHGIPWTFSKRELAKYCSQFGKVVSSHIAFVSNPSSAPSSSPVSFSPQNKETGMHGGYGFVQFRTKDAISNLNSQNMHFVEGSIVCCLNPFPSQCLQFVLPDAL